MVLGEDKHSWGSQLLNNSERDSALSKGRSTVRSAHFAAEHRWGGDGDNCTAEGGRKSV